LDPDAAVPRDAQKGLERLSKEYKWEANQGFRRAIDAYFRDFGAEILRTAPFFDYMNSWSRIPATVIALAAETGSNTSVAASLTLEFRDWLGPWLQVFSGLSDPSRELNRDFSFARDQAASAAGLIAAVFDRTAILVDNEFGDIGKKVAQQAAQRALEQFVNTGLKELSVDVRRTVGPVLATGARALATAGEVVVAALGQTHAAANVAVRKLGDFVNRAEFADAIAVKADRSELTTKADRADLAAVQNSIAEKVSRKELTDAIAVKADRVDIAAVRKELTDAVAVKADRADLATKTDLTTFQQFQTQITADVATRAKAAELQALQTVVAAKVDRTAFNTFAGQVNGQIALKAEKTELTTFQNRITTLERRVR
jgi:hypothetical protein